MDINEELKIHFQKLMDEDRIKLSLAKTFRVRRNDKCPCGSGLKYKKCCMRKLNDTRSDTSL